MFIKNTLKMYSTSCANTRHDALTFKADRMVYNVKNQMYQKQNLTFP